MYDAPRFTAAPNNELQIFCLFCSNLAPWNVLEVLEPEVHISEQIIH